MDYFTNEQKELIRRLELQGCGLGQVMVIVAKVWEPEGTAEMLEFIDGHRDATAEQLMALAAEIYAKRPRGKEDMREDGAKPEE